MRNRGWRVTARVLGLDFAGGEGRPTLVAGGLSERWASFPAGEIGAGMIAAVVEESRRTAIPGTPSRKSGTNDSRGRAIAITLGKLFAWAFQHRRVATNPALGMFRPKSPPARTRVLSNDELRRLWTALDEIGAPFAQAIRLLALTGARVGEVAGMTHAELSEDLTVWNLPADRSKNKLPHVVPLPGLAREIIASVPRLAGSRFVFSTNGVTPISGWSKIKRRLDGLVGDIPHWRLHDLRRTAVTGMAEIGVQPHVIEAVINHVSGHKSGVAGVYNRAQYSAEKRAALERWSDFVVGIVKGDER